MFLDDTKKAHPTARTGAKAEVYEYKREEKRDILFFD
jgi:hypothetical protein